MRPGEHSKARRKSQVGAAAALLAVCLSGAVLATPADEPPFDATADTVFDIIRTSDETQFFCLSDEGRAVRQMWDKRIDGESDLNVFHFTAHFRDGPPIDIILNPEFGTPEAARTEAERYTRALGQLPPVFRQGLRQLGIHKGNKSFHGGAGKVFLYSETVDLRISQDHLEESLLHEAVHASLDAPYGDSQAWRDAQSADGAFVTRYAASSPEREDLAESALFAYGLLRHPGRIPPVDSAVIARQIPARIAVIAEILNAAPDLPAPPPPPEDCR